VAGLEVNADHGAQFQVDEQKQDAIEARTSLANHLQVRFLLYIAITALTRLLAIDAKAMPDQHILVITGAIVLLVMAVATISMVRFKFPEKEPS